MTHTIAAKLVVKIFFSLKHFRDVSQVHEQLVKKSVWGDRLKQVSWRVDVKTKSRHIDQINTPTGIIELQLGKEDSEKVVCVCK